MIKETALVNINEYSMKDTYIILYCTLVFRNEEEEDHSEKAEKGTKVKRTFSSLRNRMTGSFNKDKVNNNTQWSPGLKKW